MSESENNRQGPTPKMVEFANGIAKRLNLEVPAEALNSFEGCKAFIDANKDAASAIPMGPTDKQLKFAESIASKKGVTIPAATLANSKDLSKWIDANKG